MPPKLQPWFEARQRFRLSHAHIQMARELGMNPQKFRSLANDDQASWKRPLAEFIVQCYQRRFGRTTPERVQSLEEIMRSAEIKRKARQEVKVKRKARESAPQAGHKDADIQSGTNTTGRTGL